VRVLYLTTIVFLYHDSADGWTTGRNMLMNTLWIKIHHKIEVHLLVVYTFYKSK